MEKDIEATVKGCHDCQDNSKAPDEAPLHPWSWPERPWVRVHLDFAGPFLGKMHLVVINAHSKWIDVGIMDSATTQTTIERLRLILAEHGLPETVVSDNGSVFMSEAFQQLCPVMELMTLGRPLIIQQVMIWHKDPFKCSSMD